MRYGTVPAVTGLSVKEQCEGKFRTTVLKLENVEIALADNAGVVAYGSKKVYDFDEGAILFLGAVANLTVTKKAGTNGITDTFDGDFGLGTAAANNGNALATTEQDLIPTTATAQAVSGATTAKGVSTSTEAGVVFDGTATAVDVYLNQLVDDADQDGGGTLVYSGEITLHYVLLGDK